MSAPEEMPPIETPSTDAASGGSRRGASVSEGVLSAASEPGPAGTAVTAATQRKTAADERRLAGRMHERIGTLI